LRAIVRFLPAGLPASSARSRQVSIRVSVLAAVRHHRSMKNITRCGMIVKKNLPRCGKFPVKLFFICYLIDVEIVSFSASEWSLG
jgi:hypothetical protein